MVVEAIQRDQDATEKEMVLAMDSDANLPTSSDDEAEIGDENPQGGNVKG